VDVEGSRSRSKLKATPGRALGLRLPAELAAEGCAFFSVAHPGYGAGEARARPVLLTHDAAVAAEVASLAEELDATSADATSEGEAEALVACVGRALRPGAPPELLMPAAEAALRRGWHATSARLLAALRTVVGPRTPIVASLDLHANVTTKMLQTADALVAYRTYPHEDMAEAGERAAGLLNILMQRGEKLAQAARRLPFLIPINGMCTLVEPARGVYHALASAEQRDNLHLSFAPGFPAADFSECGGVVWGYGADAVKITGAVDTLASGIVAREGDWVVPLLAPHDAVRQAMRISATASRPVVIADTQDNPGGGGDSNTTGMLRALVECGAEGAALGLMVDPDAAAAAHGCGTGRDITIALGGQSGGDAPLAATFRVEQLSDGRCIYGGPMMHGKQTDVGPTARLSLGGVQVVVSSHKDQMLDRNLYRMAGVQPEAMKILVNKSSVHFRADFQPIAEAVLVAKAPGPLLADPADFPWKKLAPGMRLRPNGPAFQKA
jgi:microcystin degradation protein MlrC